MDFRFLLKGGSGLHVLDEVSFRVYKKKKKGHKFKQNQQRKHTHFAGSVRQVLSPRLWYVFRAIW